MIDSHTVYVVSLVSQATSALTLVLLALSDRRARGLTPLALACALHAVAIRLRPLWRGTGRWPPEAASAALLVLIFFLTYVGLRSFVTHREFRSIPALFAVGGCMVLVTVLAPFSMLWSMQIASAGAICIMAVTVAMLWRAGSAAVRGPARATVCLLVTIGTLFLLRLPLEPHVPASPLLLLIRHATMLSVTLLAYSFLAVYVAETKRRLQEETRLDALTGLCNRRAMEERAAQQVRLAGRTGRPLALLMIDLDSFKLLNDTWGHSLGDRALCAVGDLLQRGTSSDDTVARMGGEEFAVLLPGRSIAAAGSLAEALRATVAGLRLIEGGRPALFTMSIGVGVLDTGETTWTEMLRRADVALYRAKREGRNRVVLCASAMAAAVPAMAERGEPRHRAAETPATGQVGKETLRSGRDPAAVLR